MIVIREFISIWREKGGLSLVLSWRAGGRPLNVFKLDKNKLFQLCFVTFVSHHTLEKIRLMFTTPWSTETFNSQHPESAKMKNEYFSVCDRSELQPRHYLTLANKLHKIYFMENCISGTWNVMPELFPSLKSVILILSPQIAGNSWKVTNSPQVGLV